jgi:hypothetical protein
VPCWCLHCVCACARMVGGCVARGE